ncbi:hypothetical protein HDV00_011335 [Rhizophlyctis rosea]|nr:hypothetical protein HDV00_011335 [Rhizophlyctis rosea]
MGARFVPCMRDFTGLNTTNITPCPAGSTPSLPNNYCTLADLCGLNFHTPTQFYRFGMPILLHAGIVHFCLNMMFQIRTGMQMERDYGWWRYAAVYLISGVGGFIFGANYAPLTPSVGCSGSIYGLMACLLLDLFQNWRLIRRPYLELFKMALQIAISLLLGTFPGIDNFAHVGGFYLGLLAGLIFMPTTHFSKWDKWSKRLLMALSVPGVVVVYVVLVKGFYGSGEECGWCKYLNCIPGMPWCESKWGNFS